MAFNEQRPSKVTIESVDREVLEGRLLTALTDEGKVAIVASERDLVTLRRALDLAEQVSPSDSEIKEFRRFAHDLKRLQWSAFR